MNSVIGDSVVCEFTTSFKHSYETAINFFWTDAQIEIGYTKFVIVTLTIRLNAWILIWNQQAAQ